MPKSSPQKLEYMRRYGHAPQRVAYMRKYVAKNKTKIAEKMRRSRLQKVYGITQEDYEALLHKQGGCCALCTRTPADHKRNCLHVDHCHTTGQIRGLLCTVHNRALGVLGDNEANLLRALAYLRGQNV